MNTACEDAALVVAYFERKVGPISWESIFAKVYMISFGSKEQHLENLIYSRNKAPLLSHFEHLASLLDHLWDLAF